MTYYYHVNGHGDVTKLTDASGNFVAEYQYDAFGNIISQSGTMASSNPYRYAGYSYDEVTGLYYLMARYYDPNTGRFITRDTFYGYVDDPLTLNLYAYAMNNPVMYIDSNGHSPYSIYNRLNAAEKKVFWSSPWKAYRAYSTKKDAESQLVWRFPLSDGWTWHNDAADAFRHAYWNALMVKRVGNDFASKFATAHEQNPNQPAWEKEMDLVNNWYGRVIAQENPNASDSELANLVWEALFDGRLIYYK